MHDLLKTVYLDDRPAMAAALDALIRRCDERWSWLPASLLAAPLTTSRWDAFVREERIVARRKGTRVEVLARRVRNALDQCTSRQMVLVVEAWLPEEDPYRWVAVATRDAVFRWFNEGVSSPWHYVVHDCFEPRAPDALVRAVIARALPALRQIFVEGERPEHAAAVAALETLEEPLRSEHAPTRLAAVAQLLAVIATVRDAADELDEMDEEPPEADALEAADDEVQQDDAAATDDALDVRQNRDEVLFRLEQLFERIGRGERHVGRAFTDARNWFSIAALAEDAAADNAVIRRYFSAPDLERWFAESAR